MLPGPKHGDEVSSKGLPLMAYTGKLCPKEVPLLSHSSEVHENVRKYVILVCKRKRLINPSSWNFKLKGMRCHSLEMLKGYNWSIEGIQNGYLTGPKCWLKGKGMNFGTLPPFIELC